MKGNKPFKAGRKILLKFLSGGVLIGCIIGFIWKAWDCIDVFISKPIATQVESVSAKEIPFPELILCHIGIWTDHHYDLDPLAKCGLTLYDYIDENDWIGNCSDPKELYEEIINQDIFYYTDMYIQDIEHDSWHYFSPLDYPNIFGKLDTQEFGRCLTIQLSETIVKNDIFAIYLHVHYWPYHVFIENRDEFFFSRQKPRAIFDSAYWITTSHIGHRFQEYEIKVDYEFYESLETMGQNCSSTYINWNKCVMNEIHEKTMEELGCTTPFGLDKTKICTDKEKAKNASKIYNDHLKLKQSKCPRNCNYLESRLTLYREIELNDANQATGNSVLLMFNSDIKKTKSVYTYTSLSLFAEIGGYLGIFVGVAILDLRSLLEHMMTN